MPSVVILGGGPAGNTCASVAATLGADVTLVERDIVGGAAHLWDCIPSKALIATGGELRRARTGRTRWGSRPKAISTSTRSASGSRRSRTGSTASITTQLESQQVRVIHGTGPLQRPARRSWSTPTAGSRSSSADFVVVATGSRPRVPDFVTVDRERVLTTRDAYPPPEIPEHAIVIGSGVTGVEFTHLFDALGSKVTLLVSRQQVLPIKDPEVAAVLEEAFLARGVSLLKGARASSVERDGDVVRVRCEDGRVDRGLARAARGRLDPEQRGPRPRRRRGRGRRAAATSRQPQLPVERRAHLRGGRRLRQAAACRRWRRCRAARSPSTSWGCTTGRTAISTTTRRRRRCSPTPRSPTSGSPRPRRSPRAARSASPRCRSPPTRRR